MKHLSKTGISMSQAQSISNMCNQRALEIDRELDSYNVCAKSIRVGGTDYNTEDPYPMPAQVIELIKEKSRLHATQAFLMEAIKSKDAEIERITWSQVNLSNLDAPKSPDYPEVDLLDSVTESWGWAQLTASEHSEYLEQEAYASHLGQFIHKNGKLAKMRKELTDMPSIEWMVIQDGVKTPVKITKHHTSQGLLDTHEQIATQHREYEQRVNYFKAKVKNLVTEENARIQKLNANAIAENKEIRNKLNQDYSEAYDAYRSDILLENANFNAAREEHIKYVASLRISVDARFQPVIDMFNNIEK